MQTVLGLVDPDQLGITLTHEHLLIDLRSIHLPGDSATDLDFFNQPVSLESVGRIRHFGAPNADNLVLSDLDIAIQEVLLFKHHGGGCLVDATSLGIARDPEGLAKISRSTGIHVVMGSSYYVGDTHPSHLYTVDEEEICEEILSDLTNGVIKGIQSGIIGEVGCSWPLGENEIKVLKASARAQALSGAPLLIHPGRHESAPLEIIDILVRAGADLNSTIIAHIDRTVFQKETLLQIANAGCYLEWDLFGREESYYPLSIGIDMPSDAVRMDDIAWVVSQGHGDKVVIAHDICSKNRLQKYGGHGYHYILAHIVPRMRTRGFTEKAIQDVLVNNPQKALTFSPNHSRHPGDPEAE